MSIIIPVYNTEKYLSDCLDSIINQTLSDIEIICINDGSTDNSLEILNKYANKDSRIKIFSKKNEGQATARNKGIKEATGEYIAFVDSDDFVDLDIFKKLYNHAKKNRLDIDMCKISVFDNETSEIDDNVWYYSLGVFRNFNKKIFSHNDTKEFTCEIAVTPYNKIYKKSFLDKNNILFPEGYIFEDEAFFFDAYLNAKRVSILNENLYYYRINRKGSTVEKTSEKDYSDIVEVFKLIREIFIETGNFENYKTLLYNRFIHLELWRFSETSQEYKESFFYKLKEDLEHILLDFSLANLNSNIRARVLKILNSDNFEDFQILDQEKEFSIIMACYNTEEYIEEAINSLITQNFGFESNVQLILVDDGSSDKTGEICKEYAEKYPDNILYIYQENSGQGNARNNGLKFAKGKYVNFLDSDDKLKPDTLTYVHDFFEKNYDLIDFVAVPLRLFGRENRDHPLNYKFSHNLIVNLVEYWDYPQLSASSAFFKREVFDKYKFGETIVSSEDSLFINKLLLDKMAYGVIKDGKYFYRKRSDNSSTIDSSNKKKEFFFNRIKYYFKELINYAIDNKGYIPNFIQYTIVYDLQWLLQVKDIEEILTPKEIKELYLELTDLLSFVDDKVILALKHDKLNLKYYMLALKHGNIATSVQKNDAFVLAEDAIIDTLSYHKLWLDIVEIKNNTLYISGLLMSFFNSDDLEIIAIKETEKASESFIANEVFYPNLEKKFLGLSLESPYNFDIKVPLNSNEKSKIKINVRCSKTNSISLDLDISFQNYVRLSKKSNYSVSGNYFLEFKDNAFYVSKYNYGKMFKAEVAILANIFKSKESYYTSALFFRIAYLILFPFYRNKRIWLFMDRRDQGDDNAEHLFKYSQSRNDKVKKYFTVSKDSTEDFNRISKIGKCLPFYSIKQRLIYLLSEKIISSHPDENILNPFLGKNIQLYSGLINSDKVFLQHGVTKDNVSNWLHKYDKNLALLVCVSNKEYDSFFSYPYNYDKNVVKVLGFPRFDNLKKELTKKQILIMPSWRESLHNKNKNEILNSQYFKKINSLVNNVDLIDIAEKYNYDIIFKPHPLVYKFIDLFDKNDNVKIDYNSRYQKLFNESALMITDYSSVAFDFAYIRKPVIYYQYGDDYNFKEGYFDYESMGFGPVFKTEKELIKSVKNYLDNDCKMEEEYANRIDSFYKYKDKNNCKRVYDVIYENKFF